MMLYILLILAITIPVYLLLIKSSKIIYLRKLALPLAAVLFIGCLFIFSDTAVKSALYGVNLWLNTVLPSLFPFFVVSELLNNTGFIRAAGVLLEPIMRPLFNVPGCGSFAFLMGVTSGYPVGAKITTRLREEKLLTKTEAERLLSFSNNSGPLFIMGAVSVGMLDMPQTGFLLLGCHILACVTVGILFRFYKKKPGTQRFDYRRNILSRFKKELASSRENNIGSIFGDAVRNSISVILAIGGFIIFFSVIINLLLQIGVIQFVSDFLNLAFIPLGIDRNLVTSLVSGFFEITTGTNMASKAAGAPFVQQMMAISMIIGWAGLSVHSQVVSIVGKTDIGIKPYLSGKFLQGIIASFYTFLAIKLAGSFLNQTKPAFNMIQSFKQPHWHTYFLNSCQYIAISIGVMLAAIIISLCINYLSSKRS